MNTTTRTYDTLHVGRSSIDLYANEIGAPFEEIKSFAAYVGGSPTNISVGARRLGLKTALSELLALTATDARIVAEVVLYLQKDGKLIDLPVALAADLVEGGVSAIRIYHSTWPLTSGHIVRTPMLEPEEGLDEPEVVEKYMAGIAKPDIEAVLALFVDDGYAREPSGSEYKYAGPEGLKTFYGAALSGGGIPLKHCTASFDSMRCAVEFICDEWANVKLPAQAGLAVYELAGDDKIQAARIYDDVTPPFE